jgi:iron(III) transport system permease protein
VAFLQAMTLVRFAGDFGAASGFHTMTTKIWSLFQFPPKT